jgi:glutaredoxin-dependent peroxiredoxin
VTQALKSLMAFQWFVALRVGQRAPGFELPDSEGKVRKLDELVDQGGALLAFFPFAFSGVCDREMCAFRDGFPELSGMGTQIVGISVDSAFTLRAFAQTYDLRFPLLSDFNKAVVRAYGVLQNPWVGLGYREVAKRSVFLIDGKRVVRYRWVTDNPGEEPPYSELMRTIANIRK